MYVTKKLSSLRAAPHLMSLPPPDGPYSGIAVILDVDAVDPNDEDCFGVSGPVPLENLPIPQNKKIGIGKSQILTGLCLSFGISDSLMMIPVIDEPLSSNTYYVIQASSEHAGLALTCSRNDEDELAGSKGAKKQPFDPHNINQQFKIICCPGGASSEMYAESLAIDARPPSFMRKDKWVSTITASPMSWSCNLNEAEGQGLCERLRNALPEFGFSIGVTSSKHVVVGRWYVPFMFVKEFGMRYSDQMRSSMYYKMSLEQRWEKIYETENRGGSDTVVVDVRVKSEEVMLGGTVRVQGRHADGVVRYENVGNAVKGIGLTFGVVERMKWEQMRAGWVDVAGREVSVNERYFNGSGWRRFGCYVLVERFVLKRMTTGSLVLAYDFCHIHQLRTKWE